MNRPLHPAKARAQRTFTPKFFKPTGQHCEGCALEHKGPGFVPVCGEVHAPIMLVGEAPASDEIATGAAFMGAAGSMLTRVLKLIGRHREQYRIANIVSCWVPDFNTDKWPSAVAQCHYLDDAIAQHTPTVVVPMGGAALRRVLQLPRSKHTKVENFHGTVSRDPTDRFWVVPTYHPSHLQRGATNLMGVCAFDLTRASEVAESGWPADPGELFLDPPWEWFKVWCCNYMDAVSQDPFAYPLAVDIETPEKGSDEAANLATAEDLSYAIKRVNLSAGPDEGITIPFEEPYLSLLRMVLGAGGVQYYWFKGFDYPRLVSGGMRLRPDRAYDCMWAWHALQSDLPQGLGFVAPFYSKWPGAWKALADSQPVYYAAVDAIQTRRVGDGVMADLVKEGQWDVFHRHMHQFHYQVLQPATDIGVPIDRARLVAFKARLDKEASRLLDAIATLVPPELCPITPKEGLKRPPTSTEHPHARLINLDGTAKADPPDPLKVALYARATVIEKLVLCEVLLCRTCGKQEIQARHRCQPSLIEGMPDAIPQLAKAVVSVTRWYWQEPFNPDSPQQLLAYAEAKGHQPGKAKQTGAPSMDRETLGRLWREHGDELYKLVMDYRAVGKVRGTYAVGTEKRLDVNDRIHPSFTFKPSTMRLSCVNPNIQNVVADKEGKESLAAGFRTCVVAKGRELSPAVWDSAKMLEFDYSGIEQVVMGWFMRDPDYIRIAKLGVHAIVASHALHRRHPTSWAPADLTKSDTDIAAYLTSIKRSKVDEIVLVYDQCKRTVHGTAYGLTTFGMCRNFPAIFPTVKVADTTQKLYFDLAPGVPRFHAVVRHQAHTTHFLGGPPPYVYDAPNLKVTGHPFAYRHFFWSVVAYERLQESQRLWRLKRGMPLIDINGIWYGVALGEDAKRCVADYPQSTARGVLTEATFPLFPPDSPDYIGDVYYGSTPLRAPIHDSLLLEVPTRLVDRVIERVARAMQAPILALPCPAEWGIGAHLVVNIDAKIGLDWASMEKIALPTAQVSGVASDTPFTPAEESDEIDVAELEGRLGAA